MKVLGWVMYLIGFIVYVVFLTLAKNISLEAWLYAIGSSLGVLIFCESEYFRNKK